MTNPKEEIENLEDLRHELLNRVSKIQYHLLKAEKLLAEMSNFTNAYKTKMEGAKKW